MTTYSIRAPNGKTYTIDGPEGASQAEVAQAVVAQHPEANNPIPPATSFTANVNDTAVHSASKPGSVEFDIAMPDGHTYAVTGPAGSDRGQAIVQLLRLHPEAAHPAGQAGAMPIKAELADGRVLEFPAGTDPAVVQATVKRTLGLPQVPASVTAAAQSPSTTATTQADAGQPIGSSNPNSSSHSPLEIAVVTGLVIVLVPSALSWILTRHLWRKPRDTPHKLGYLIGARMASLGLGLGAAKLVSPILSGGVASAYWEIFLPYLVASLAWLILGYAIGWTYRKFRPIPASKSGPNVTKTELGHPSTLDGATSSGPTASAVNVFDSTTALNEDGRSAPVQVATDKAVPSPDKKQAYEAHAASTVNAFDSTDALNDESLYEAAMKELTENRKPGVWAMALAQTANGGNTEGAYIALRVAQLKAERMAAEAQQRQRIAADAANAQIQSERKAFYTVVSAIRQGSTTGSEFVSRYESLRQYRNPVDARHLVHQCGYDALRPGEDTSEPKKFTVKRRGQSSHVGVFDSDAEFAEWAVKAFA